jgi:fumarate hydratase class II
MADDLRLMSSGPRAGLIEIRLPAVQPGSSIMPGKVNPVMPEMLNMVCLQCLGCDATIIAAAQSGQLELNVMMPVIAHNLLHEIAIITGGIKAFTEKCVIGI